MPGQKPNVDILPALKGEDSYSAQTAVLIRLGGLLGLTAPSLHQQARYALPLKYRRKIVDQDAIEKLHRYFGNLCADFDVKWVEMDGERDHVHLLINYLPKLAI